MLNILVLHSFLLLLVLYPVNKLFIHLLREIKEFLVFSLIFVVQLQAMLWRYFLYMSPKIEVPHLGLHSRRWVAGEWVKFHLYLQLLPIPHITTWALPPVRSGAALDSHRGVNPNPKVKAEYPEIATK